MKKSRLLGAVCAVAFTFIAASTNAALLGRDLDGNLATAEAYYDDIGNLTWLANANLAGTAMTWDAANAWAAALDIDGNPGADGWRLPNTPQPDSSCRDQSGGISSGYDCTGSEMGNLFYNVLGGVAGTSLSTTHNSNYYLFSNVLVVYHWSSTDYARIANNAWAFSVEYGFQFDYIKSLYAYAWAVHSGDFGTAVIPVIDIEKLTNSNQADGADDLDVPRIAQGATVTWTYEVTNTGGVAFSEAEIIVTDSQPGVVPVLDIGSDTGGDMILSPGETWIYTATAQALDLEAPPVEITVVQGCNTSRNTYQNTGRAEIVGTQVFDEDASHYCNPLMVDSDSDGVDDDQDNCINAPNGPLFPDNGGNIQLDTDGDGYGNMCDGDLNQSGFVDFADLTLFSNVFFTADPDADLDGSSFVQFADLTIFSGLFFQPPGPSCCAP